jgi:hypothetical protein
MRADGISPRKAPKIFKQLGLGVAVLEEMKQFTPKKKSIITKALIASDRLKKNRSITALGRALGVHRQLGVRRCQKRLCIKRATYSKLENTVLEFLKRPDNSVCMPGKKDTLTIHKVKHQMYVLSDYLHILYRTFLIEKPGVKMSYLFFSGVRAKYRYIKLVGYQSMNSCLCKTHENMQLLLKAVPRLPFNSSPDEFVRETTVEQAQVILEEQLTTPTITYWEWGQAEVTYGNVIKKRIKRIQYSVEKPEFVTKFINQMPLFKAHATRVIAQYKAVHTLKNNLPDGHITVQMDFAENWSVATCREIQSAYFAKDQLTIHPVVVHYSENGSLLHKSYILVSDERNHSAPTVYSFMQALVPNIREEIQLEHIHYITDSPSSQYRNIHMFSVLAKHKDLFGVSASWLYFEAGHGKGPCDGVGGSSKRMADDYVRRGNSITTAAQYAEYGNSSGKVTYVVVPKDVIAEGGVTIDRIRTTRKVKGTMTYHAAVCIRQGVLAMRKTSCYGPCCFQEGTFVLGCQGWTEHVLFPQPQTELVPAMLPNQQTIGPPEAELVPATLPNQQTVGPAIEDPLFQVGSWLVADFNSTYYVGKVVRGLQDGRVLVDYLHLVTGKLKRYNWPVNKDTYETDLEDIFMPTLPAPITTGGKKRRQYCLVDGLREKVISAHQRHVNG